MLKCRSNNRQVLMAFVLVVVLLFPTGPLNEASASGSTAREMGRQPGVLQAADPLGELAGVSRASVDWWTTVQQQIEEASRSYTATIEQLKAEKSQLEGALI